MIQEFLTCMRPSLFVRLVSVLILVVIYELICVKCKVLLNDGDRDVLHSRRGDFFHSRCGMFHSGCVVFHSTCVLF